MRFILKENLFEGKQIKLALLEESHRNDLLVTAADEKLWCTSVPSENTISAYIAKALSDFANGTAFPFVVVLKDTGRIIGSTRYIISSSEYSKLAIGGTWYAKKTKEPELTWSVSISY